MKKYFVVILVIIMSISLISCGGANIHNGKVQVPSDSSTQQGENYKDVIEDFNNAGFTNIKTEKVDDLITGLINKDGEVKTVTINGNEDYSSDAWYPKNAKVVIKYHTFAHDDGNATKDNINYSKDELANDIINKFNTLGSGVTIERKDVLCKKTAAYYETTIKLGVSILTVSYSDGSPYYSCTSNKKFTASNKRSFIKESYYSIIAAYDFMPSKDVKSLLNKLDKGKYPVDNLLSYKYKDGNTTQEYYFSYSEKAEDNETYSINFYKKTW